MNRQYAIVFENFCKNYICDIKPLAHKYGLEIFVNPKADIDRYDGVLLVYDDKFRDGLFCDWVGHSHIEVTSKKDIIQGFKHLAGIPIPLEIERKFVIKYPDTDYLKVLANCKGVEISQTYLDIPNANVRVRKRNNTYIKTEKIKLSDMTRKETESLITEKEYLSLLKQKHRGTETISKTRYCVLWRGKYYEIDVFPFWDKIAYMEIELKCEDEQFEIPNFIDVIKEVTYDSEYTNKSLTFKLKNNSIKDIQKDCIG